MNSPSNGSQNTEDLFEKLDLLSREEILRQLKRLAERWVFSSKGK